jgi:hypothetical protein
MSASTSLWRQALGKSSPCRSPSRIEYHDIPTIVGNGLTCVPVNRLNPPRKNRSGHEVERHGIQKCRRPHAVALRSALASSMTS